MALFVQDMSLRPSCYKCAARGGRSGSDLTLSDLWSVQRCASELSDDKGVSGVYVNTVKGRELLDSLTGLCSRTVDMALSRQDNGGFYDPAAVPVKREEFFSGMHSCEDLLKHMKSYVVRKPLWKRAYRALRAFLSACKKKILK